MKFNRLWVTGDTHGDFDWLRGWCEENATTERDAIIILGDAGILYYGPKTAREKALKSYLASMPITLLCVRGNHEARPQNYDNMLQGDFRHDPIVPNRMYYEEECPNIIYLHDGGDYVINGRSYLVIGGAYSIDRPLRQLRGWRWFADEELTQEEFCNIADKVDHHKYDFVLTHTCPYSWMPTDLFIPGIDQSEISNHTEKWLETISNIIDYDHWLFGHFHQTRFNMDGKNSAYMIQDEIFNMEDFDERVFDAPDRRAYYPCFLGQS